MKIDENRFLQIRSAVLSQTFAPNLSYFGQISTAVAPFFTVVGGQIDYMHFGAGSRGPICQSDTYFDFPQVRLWGAWIAVNFVRGRSEAPILPHVFCMTFPGRSQTQLT